MAERKLKQRKLTKFSSGDLRDPVEVVLRSQRAPGFDDADVDESYEIKLEPFCSISTIETQSGGERKFSGVNLNRDATHIFVMRFTDILTVDHRIRFKSEFYKILEFSDPERRQQYSVVQTQFLGREDIEANR